MSDCQPVCIHRTHARDSCKHTEMTTNEEMSQTHRAPNQTVFHAVYIPQEYSDHSPESNDNDNVHVYVDKVEALKMIKEHKTGRLKTFKNLTDAKQYAKTGYEITNSCAKNIILSPTPVAEEKSSNFKAPKLQDLVGLKKLIETGDVDVVRKMVWENPRYLISSGDTPAILKEGYRYNALHIAVIAGRADMCELILSTVGNTDFVRFLYGEEERRNYLDRAEIILDLYLNTPDKRLLETPLHFAVKFGLIDVVKVLVSYSQCIKTMPNKYDQTPMDIICSRKCQGDEELKRQIRMLLEDQYYVPVLRSEDNTLQPIIGEPFSPTNPLCINTDPISPRVEVRAFAGPMSKSQATEFRKKWKTPPRLCRTPIKRSMDNSFDSTNNHAVNLAVRFQDTEKGLERVGRDLAKEYEVAWKEFWPFLKDFADFRCADGLQKLEKYLENRFKEHVVSNETGPKTDSTLQKFELSQEIDDICDKLQSCSLGKSLEGESDEISDASMDDDDLEFITPPSSPVLTRQCSEDEMYTAEESSAVFIEGSTVSKTDYDVYNAVPTSVDPNKHPHICLWRQEVEIFLNQRSLRSPNPSLTRRKLLMSP